MDNYYKVLGVTRQFKPDDLKEARRQRAKHVHPDKTGDNGEAMVLLNEAFATLNDPAKRRKYDIELGRRGSRCVRCDGRGVHYKFRGFTERRELPCDYCQGAGILLPESSRL